MPIVIHAYAMLVDGKILDVRTVSPSKRGVMVNAIGVLYGLEWPEHGDSDGPVARRFEQAKGPNDEIVTVRIEALIGGQPIPEDLKS